MPPRPVRAEPVEAPLLPFAIRGLSLDVQCFEKLSTNGFGVMKGLVLALGMAIFTPASVRAQEVTVSDPVDVSVTIYRAPYRNGGAINLGALGGFAVVTETRRVTLPAGRSRLRFEGVVDGIVPESAIISGLPGGVIEKNRDAALLSPATLLRASLGRQLLLRRTNPATGRVVLVPAEVTAANETGVTLRTRDGLEALQCSGTPEAVRYEPGANGLSARPTLSVQTRSARPISAVVTLTYLAQGFDWSASYTAQVAPDGKTLDLGGWITLANGNSVSLNNAQTQIVAGGLNREYVRQFLNAMPRALANCWPMQRTSDVPLKPERPYQLVQPFLGLAYDNFDEEMDSREYAKMRRGFALPPPPPPPPPPMVAMAMPSAPPPPEQLGDLKLYRVPQRTTVAAQQMKQTRLVEQHGVPFDRIYTVTLPTSVWYRADERRNAEVLLRTRNDKAHQLGLPLPAGAFLIEQAHAGRMMLVGEPDLRDTAEDEKVELRLGEAPDVNLRRTVLHSDSPPDLLAGLSDMLTTRVKQGKQVERVEIANAGSAPISFELKYDVSGSQRLDQADHPLDKEDGHPIFRLTVPANQTVTLHYTVLDR